MTTTTIVLSVLLAITIASNADPKVIKKRDQFPSFTTPDFYSLFCKNNPFASQFAVCSTTVPPTASTSTPKTSTPEVGTTTTMSTTTVSSTTSDDFEYESSTSTPFQLETSAAPDANSSSTVLERAHWCRFNNGSYISLGYTFMYSACAICQCTQSRAIRCTTLQCMPSFCIDNSTPTRRPDQCCSQCAYENGSSSCTYRGVTFPHGTLVQRASNGMQCWCQLGNIECRRSVASAFDGMNLWGEGTAVYVIVVIVGVVLLLGTLLCGATTVCFYFYYKRNQSTLSAHDQYLNNAGWQPMGADGQVFDGSAEEKQAEADAGQYNPQYPTGTSEEYIPPPYALYNGGYATEQQAANPKA